MSKFIYEDDDEVEIVAASTEDEGVVYEIDGEEVPADPPESE